MTQTSPRAVLITGASSGIGRATAILLAQAGFRVFAGVRKDSDGAALTQAQAANVVPVRIDVTQADSIAAAKAFVAERVEDGLYGLVNNAGIGLSAPIEYVALDELRRVFDVNVFGQIAVAQAFLPLIRKRHGRIVNIGSVGSHVTIPFGGVLCASKYAFRSLNDALRLELHPFGIHVAMIEPGGIATPAVDKTLGDVEAVIQKLPPEGVTRYAAMLRTFHDRTYRREKNGSAPEVVARAVLRALTDARPHARYPVGKDARVLLTMPRVLPDRVLDRIRFRLFGIPARAITT